MSAGSEAHSKTCQRVIGKCMALEEHHEDNFQVMAARFNVVKPQCLTNHCLEPALKIFGPG